MHFLIRETLSFNLMYVTACYPVGTTISKTSSPFTALLQHYSKYMQQKTEADDIFRFEEGSSVDLDHTALIVRRSIS